MRIERPGQRPWWKFFSNHIARRTAPIRGIIAKRIALGKLKNPGSEKQTSLMMAGKQIHVRP